MFNWFRANSAVLLPFLVAQAMAADEIPAGAGARTALMVGSGVPYLMPNGGTSHPEVSAANFLRLVGNPENDPAKGWTLEFTGNLMVKLGMNPANTSLETLFKYIGEHQLGYRVAMNCGPGGYAMEGWETAVDNGIMPFGPQGHNSPGFRVDSEVGLRAAVGCAGGYTHNLTTIGPGVEFFDHAFPADYAQSWANQAVAAKYAWLLDAHPNYNIWDARQHARQAASFWSAGWTDTNGYGTINTNLARASMKLLPGPPVDFTVTKSREGNQVRFAWRNFRQSDFAATVIARKDGQVIYDGVGTNFVWTSDRDGDQTFVYWSRNKSGEKSRMESYQKRKVAGLKARPLPACLVLGAPAGNDNLNLALAEGFQSVQTNWLCDLIYRPGHRYYDIATAFPVGNVVARLAGVGPMVDYAIANHYRVLVAPISPGESDLFASKSDWDRAVAAGILVVLPHHSSMSVSRKAQARRLSPPRLYSAITVGAGTTSNQFSFGPGLEVFDAPLPQSAGFGRPGQLDAAAIVAGKLSLILEANPEYNLWDARQHLRQSASGYAAGWVEDGGYGRPPAKPVKLKQLDLAPPIDMQVVKSDDAKTVTFSWQNFLQTRFAETVIMRDDTKIYHGTGTNLIWHSDIAGDATFRFHSRDKVKKLSRPESYATFRVEGLQKHD